VYYINAFHIQASTTIDVSALLGGLASLLRVIELRGRFILSLILRHVRQAWRIRLSVDTQHAAVSTPNVPRFPFAELHASSLVLIATWIIWAYDSELEGLNIPLSTLAAGHRSNSWFIGLDDNHDLL